MKELSESIAYLKRASVDEVNLEPRNLKHFSMVERNIISEKSDAVLSKIFADTIQKLNLMENI